MNKNDRRELVYRIVLGQEDIRIKSVQTQEPKSKTMLEEIADCVSLLSLDELRKIETEVVQSAWSIISIISIRMKYNNSVSAYRN